MNKLLLALALIGVSTTVSAQTHNCFVPYTVKDGNIFYKIVKYPIDKYELIFGQGAVSIFMKDGTGIYVNQNPVFVGVNIQCVKSQ